MRSIACAMYSNSRERRQGWLNATVRIPRTRVRGAAARLARALLPCRTTDVPKLRPNGNDLQRPHRGKQDRPKGSGGQCDSYGFVQEVRDATAERVPLQMTRCSSSLTCAFK